MYYLICCFRNYGSDSYLSILIHDLDGKKRKKLLIFLEFTNDSNLESTASSSGNRNKMQMTFETGGM